MDQDTSFLRIDQGRLDREWLRQPELYHTHARNLAEAKLKLEEAESSFDATKAELTLDIYERPSAYDLDKATKDTVEAALIKCKQFQAAAKAVRQARYELELLNATVKALEHKKRALENLVTLHGQDYFSEPRASGEAKEQFEQDAKRRVRTMGRKRLAAEEDDDS